MISKRTEAGLVKLARRKAVIRPSDAVAHGFRREHLARLAAQGRFIRIGRGLYTLADAQGSAHRSLAETASAIPGAVVCLLTALRFHGLTTQLPSQVWIALEQKAWRPRSAPFAVRVVYFSGAAFREGVEQHVIDGVPVRIYSAAKTVADCFKYRHKIGIDVAVEALRDYLRKHRSGMDELWRFARVCRVARVMQPYLEAI